MMRICPTPTDNFPFTAETFGLIRRIAPDIKRFSARYNVYPIAVAGAIADEYNTRTDYRAVLDWLQDDIVINWLPDWFISSNARININSKWLNATKHDIGIGNIKLETAKRIYERYKNVFGKRIGNWEELVDYLRTDTGTIHLTALVIKRAQFLLGPYVKSYPVAVKEAVFITYYKQGPIYLARFRSRPSHEKNRLIRPGEGCRTYHQRDEFKKVLGMK